MPQDMLDLIPKSKCQNCLYVNAMNECKECGEFYCEKVSRDTNNVSRFVDV